MDVASDIDRLIERRAAREPDLDGLETFERRSVEVGQALGLIDHATKTTLGGLSNLPSPEDRRGLANRGQGR